MTIAVIDIRPTRRPFAHAMKRKGNHYAKVATTGYRIKACVPNRAQVVTGFTDDRAQWRRTESFAPKFLIAESGDYTTEEKAREAMASFVRGLMEWHGVTSLATPQAYPHESN